MKDKFKTGDQVLNVSHLNYIGDYHMWPKVSTKLFNTVAGVGECRPWSEIVSCFSISFSDVKKAAETPMHRNKIFHQDTGFDMDRQRERYLHTKNDRDEIIKVLDKKVKDSINKESLILDQKIRAVEQELAALRGKKDKHVVFCNSCRSEVINSLS
jgi:hypothetical protein